MVIILGTRTVNNVNVDYTRIRGTEYRKTRLKDLWVSHKGKVYNGKRKKFLSPSIVNGYRAICRDKVTYVHRMVGEVWIEVPKPYKKLKHSTASLTIDHIDYDRTNNDVSNLRWLTLEENIGYGHQKRIIRRKGNNIKKYDSLQDAALDLINKKITSGTVKSVQSHISKVARKLRSHNKAYGFEFEYEK